MLSDVELRLPAPELIARWQVQGFWRPVTIGQALAEALPGMEATPLCAWSQERPARSTVGAAAERAARFAGALAGLGVGPGDVVAVQLPNWEEAAVAFWGAALAGAVLAPIVHGYGPREVDHILSDTGARVLVAGFLSRQADALDGLASLRAAHPALEHVVVVGDAVPAGCLAFEPLLAEAAPRPRPAAADPDGPAIVGYTSGSTAAPKGVVHSHRTWLSAARNWLPNLPPVPYHPELIPAPVAHSSGLVSLMTPLTDRAAIHLLDRWDPSRALALCRSEGFSIRGGVTIFLTSVLDLPELRPDDVDHLRWVSLGGSPIPVAVAERADRFGIRLIRGFGCTEHLGISVSAWDDPVEARLRTDGRVYASADVRIVGPDGRDVAVGEAGEVLSRGPDRFLGYTDPAETARAIDADGFFATGDLGRLDADGFLTVVGRVKDIIIRGGENISALDVEEALQQVPGVLESAVVAMPDPALGERVCAFVRTEPGRRVDLAVVREHLAATGLARQKWPEHVEQVGEFERTPSGKVHKPALRARAAALAARS